MNVPTPGAYSELPQLSMAREVTVYAVSTVGAKDIVQRLVPVAVIQLSGESQEVPL
jgi:hypothetical protein